MRIPIEQKNIPENADVIFTRRNADTVPGYATWRIPAMQGTEVIQMDGKFYTTFTGHAVNKLGWLESWDISMEDLETLLKEKGIKRRG